MDSVEDKLKSGVLDGGAQTLASEMKLMQEMHENNGVRKALNNELWHACAGPLVSLPQVGSLVYYFPQGHSEQVAASTKRPATSQIPNYPNLPSQLLCQVQNVTLHADRETDEIYAQMSLQPVNSEKDVFPVPDFGYKLSKHPSEFFCKTLTASDTSTHGGFSVPRRAAEKLFPPLDYTIQPPTQELVVRDLHDNTWTFRHIYRGQPKRHLLTTGWSMFVGSKRLKAGDAVLFIRDDKSQLLVGVRRANRQQTTLPSSVLSADSMHIGVLAAAAHAAASKCPFTIFYNPRACPSEFVIPLAKYRKAAYGTHLSGGMRFGMMFETEESGKRRYMGTVIGVSDLDPLRWPGSKWRNTQVEWDEPGSSDKPSRVSSWEIETPESLFIFPSLASCLKRPFYSGFFGAEHEWGVPLRRPFMLGPGNGNVDIPNSLPNQYPEHLIKTFTPHSINPGTFTSVTGQEFTAKADFSHDMNRMAEIRNQNFHTKYLESMLLQNQVLSQAPNGQPDALYPNSMSKVEQLSKLKTVARIGSPHHSGIIPIDPPRLNSEVLDDQVTALTSFGECNVENSIATPAISDNHGCQVAARNQNQGFQQYPTRLCSINSQFEPLTFYSQPIDVPQSDPCYLSGLTPGVDTNDYMPYSSSQPSTGIMESSGPSSRLASEGHPSLLPEVINPSLLPTNQEIVDQNPRNSSSLPPANQVGAASQLEASSVKCISSSNDLKDLSEGSNHQSGVCSAHNVNNSNSIVIDPSISNAILDEFCTLKDDCIVGNLSSSQDIQSQITCASLAESQTFCLPEFPDNSVGTSSSNVDFDDGCLLQNGSWQQMQPPIRTYTKVQKAGSVGRSIDVTCFRNYEELCSGIERMFGLDGLLNDTKGSGWKLVYVDYENDVLLVGDDPWEEFVGCVRCIRILSPSEVKQMSEEGMQLLNRGAIQGIKGSISD